MQAGAGHFVFGFYGRVGGFVDFAGGAKIIVGHGTPESDFLREHRRQGRAAGRQNVHSIAGRDADGRHHPDIGPAGELDENAGADLYGGVPLQVIEGFPIQLEGKDDLYEERLIHFIQSNNFLAGKGNIFWMFFLIIQPKDSIFER